MGAIKLKRVRYPYCKTAIVAENNKSESMNYLDIIYAIPLAYLIYKGLRRGLVFELASLAGVVAGCWAAVHFSQVVSDLLELKGDGAALIAFFLTFVAVVLLSKLLGKAARNLLKMVKLGFVDTLAGAALGCLKAACILGVLTSYLMLADTHHAVLKPEATAHSKLYKPIRRTGDWLIASLQTYVSQRRYAREMEQQQGDEPQEQGGE